MGLEATLRLTEVLLAIALLQRGAEHLAREPALFAPQIVLALALAGGLAPHLALIGIWLLGLAQLCRFCGPYNGGADKMVLLCVSALTVANLLPALAPVALGYLAVQVILSYFVSGWVKLRNRDWWSGHALAEVFAYSVYPSAEDLRPLARHQSAMRWTSRVVIAFELAFPLALITPITLSVAVCLAAVFHLLNALLLGLNRFFWAWLAVLPSTLWLQSRLVG